MKAMQVNMADTGPALIPAELRKPEPGSGEILIHVHAAGVTPTELLVEPNQKQLAEVAMQLDAGRLRAFVKATFALNDASSAYSGEAKRNSGHGKVVVVVQQ